MKRSITFVLAVVALVGAASLVFQPVFAQGGRATAQNVPVIPWEPVAGFFKSSPGIYAGENMGISTDTKGNVYIFHRANETRLFQYNAQGVFVRELGRNNYGFAFAHSVRVDAQDNIWAVDEGTDTLVKFNQEGRIIMTVGRRQDPVYSVGNMSGSGGYSGRNEKYKFSRQTDMGWDQQGNFFVSDGYADGRVVKFDKNGKFVKSAGTRGNGNLQFNTPHSIAVDWDGNVYVGDRGNSRVQVLDNDLNWKQNYTNVGAPWAVCVSGGPAKVAGQQQFLYSSNSWGDSMPFEPMAYTGEVYKMQLDGTVVGKFGKAGKQPGEFATIHQMDCRDPNTIYTAEINEWRSQKIILKPAARPGTMGN